ncbi:MAG: hypothetical protein U5N26_06745 [Candidatus Marinimicrobia bacterium]|nr:hypothetical protein [Candidatus Neomarinimicrobiota bacterium]
MPRYQKKYDLAFRRMNTQPFRAGNDFTLSENDIVKNGVFDHKMHLFLGCYPTSVIESMFKRYKVREYFAEKGIPSVNWHVNMDDPYVHRFMLTSESGGKKHKLIELVMQRKNLKLPLEDNRFLNLEFLHIEWLMMQNPYKKFRRDKPPLPGQKAPGLGVGLHMLQILLQLAKKTNTHGLINSPNYLHTALFFSRAFHFLDPKTEAFIQIVKYQLLPQYSHYTLSWADEYGALQHALNHRKVKWRPSTMVAPITQEAKRYFYKRNYRKKVRRHRKKMNITVNMRKLKEEAEGTWSDLIKPVSF